MVKRNIGLDLLRIISMIMIVVLHYFAKGGFLWETQESSFLWYMVWGLEALCLVSVNCYVLISAYFLVDSNGVKYRKVIKLVGEMWFYSAAISVILLLLGAPFSTKDFIYSFLPFICKSYWFINTYILLYLLHPYLNKIVWGIERKQFEKLLFILVLFFSIAQSIIPIPEMTLDESHGYGIIWFVVIYMLAAYIKRFEQDMGSYSKKIYVVLFIGGIACVLSRRVIGYLCNTIGLDGQYLDIWYNYNSVPILISSVALFLFFLKYKVSSKISFPVVSIASATLGVYLIHEQFKLKQILWKEVLKVGRYYNSSKMFINMICVVTGIFLFVF